MGSLIYYLLIYRTRVLSSFLLIRLIRLRGVRRAEVEYESSLTSGGGGILESDLFLVGWGERGFSVNCFMLTTYERCYQLACARARARGGGLILGALAIC